MKAIILSAGKGERLGLGIPKTMIKVNGKPILEHNIELCKKCGITDIYINLHYQPDIIMKYFGNGKNFGVNINYSYENELLGTSGAVKNIANKDLYFMKNDFFVIYGDNYSNYDINQLISESSIANIAFHYRDDVTNSGVAEFDNYRIISFIEKPKQNETSSHWVNAGIYYLKPEILNYIPNGISDFSKDIFPKLLENNIPFYGLCIDLNVSAFDTPEMLKENKLKFDVVI